MKLASIVALAFFPLLIDPSGCPSDTRPDVYDELKNSITNPAVKTATVTDRRVYGTFHEVSSCTVDNATCIQGKKDNGSGGFLVRYWKRQFTDYEPRFWSIGSSCLVSATSGYTVLDDGIALSCAGYAASLVGGTVRLATKGIARKTDVIETKYSIFVYDGVTYDGLGRAVVRRKGKVSAFSLLAPNVGGTMAPFVKGVVLRGINFDGNRDHTDPPYTWLLNGTGELRGKLTVENCTFSNTPGENITTCGAKIHRSIFTDLGGSAVHKSCASTTPIADRWGDFKHNWVVDANRLTDAVLLHSEGALTLSGNAGWWRVEGNIFAKGAEGVFGIADDDCEIKARGNIYANFPRVITDNSARS